MKKLLVTAILLVALLVLINFFSKPGNFQNLITPQVSQPEKVKVVTEESVTIDTVKKVGPSVVTVSEQGGQTASPFDFGPLFQQQPQPTEPQNIGSGFVLDKSGLIVTNKHVVSDTGVKYTIITNDDKTFDVKKIYRDPLNDIAILQIDPSQNPSTVLKPVVLGDSSHLQVGQFVIAIGTALGEFRNTVTTGVISGLGRGITAGSDFQGFAERLDNVIQTDAAINPGNSGGPLLNSSAEVIGINTAVASGGQNIGFALPISVVKDSLKNFNEGGQFNRPYLGVVYKMISRDLAMANSVPEGAYIQQVVIDSPADKGGIKNGDIITKIDGEKLVEGQTEPSTLIAKKKVGDTITLDIWRDNKIIQLKIQLQTAPNQ